MLTVRGRYTDNDRRDGYLLASLQIGGLVSWPRRDGDDDRFVASARDYGKDGLKMALPAIEWMDWETVGC